MREETQPRLRFRFGLAAPWLLLASAAPGLTPATGACTAITVVCEFCPSLVAPERLVLHSVWQNHGAVAGGPLVTPFVYDPSRHRLYGVQGQLFAPGDSKRALLFELEALLLTFRLEEIS